jgi:hypothetical protein
MKPLNRLIGICGAAGSGKDTLAEGLASIDVYFVYHFADPIKAALNAMFGWGPAYWQNREWKEAEIPWLTERPAGLHVWRYGTMDVTPRTLAQTLGTEWGRNMIHPELWLRIAREKYRKMSGQAVVNTKTNGEIAAMGMIIPDVRFENEAKWIKAEGGILLKVHRPGVEPVAQHASEQADLTEWVDYTILNDAPPSHMISNARELIWQESLRS